MPVAWLGPVHSTVSGVGPFFACASCCNRLEELVRGHLARADQAA
ncbi:hypothetical protein [Streptomyces sp. ODS05-4]|nr:hypothetical protein [Streptomyces sp. ODS05-4]